MLYVHCARSIRADSAADHPTSDCTGYNNHVRYVGSLWWYQCHGIWSLAGEPHIQFCRPSNWCSHKRHRELMEKREAKKQKTSRYSSHDAWKLSLRMDVAATFQKCGPFWPDPEWCRYPFPSSVIVADIFYSSHITPRFCFKLKHFFVVVVVRLKISFYSKNNVFCWYSHLILSIKPPLEIP